MKRILRFHLILSIILNFKLEIFIDYFYFRLLNNYSKISKYLYF
uniref:Uncharacterized protein n=1 Tax=Heterorhabditis bacteriophora TaxID=37862 RepID=A0A1I7WV29_HETBA